MTAAAILINAAIHAGWVLAAVLVIFFGVAAWIKADRAPKGPLRPVSREPWARGRWR